VITLAMPFAVPVFTFQLPNPRLGDSLQDSLGTKFAYSMSGVVKTIIRRNQDTKLVWSFNLANCGSNYRDYIDEMINTYANEDIKITDWRGDIWRVKCVSNPVELTESKNYQDVTLEFQGTKQ